MPPENLGQLSQPIVTHVQVVAIELMVASSARFPELDQRDGFDVPLLSTTELNAMYHESNRRIIAAVKFELKATENDVNFAAWSAVYRLIYQVDEAYAGDQTKARAEAFCQTYSVAHAWPYWREHLASQCVKMGLPIVLAPIMVVGATPTIQQALSASPE